MKNGIKKLLYTLAKYLMWIIGIVYPYSLSQRLKNYRNILYTLWMRNFVGGFGEGSMFCYSCKLWGGGSDRIKIGKNTTIQANCILGCWIKYAGLNYNPYIIIGDNCNIGEHTHISSINKITIGNGLLTGRYVYIGDNSHGGLSLEESIIPPIKRELQSKGEIVIGENVWIGDKVTILGGVTIGDNVIVGSNSVVTHDAPSNCLIAGTPANIIKRLV